MNVEPVKDRQTVTADGSSIEPTIDGLVIRRMAVQVDTRGELEEVYHPDWSILPDPLVHIYRVTVYPQAGRGWVIHREQEDRIYHCAGRIHWAFYDDRAHSPTHKMINTITLSPSNRSLFVIPRGVYHACFNYWNDEAVFINMPTRPYDYADPDKYRLPIKNDLIPYDFSAQRMR